MPQMDQLCFFLKAEHGALVDW